MVLGRVCGLEVGLEGGYEWKKGEGKKMKKKKKEKQGRKIKWGKKMNGWDIIYVKSWKEEGKWKWEMKMEVYSFGEFGMD